MKTELKLENIEMELDGAEGGKIWIFGEDDEMCYIKASEIDKVIEFISQFKKDK